MHGRRRCNKRGIAWQPLPLNEVMLLHGACPETVLAILNSARQSENWVNLIEP